MLTRLPVSFRQYYQVPDYSNGNMRRLGHMSLDWKWLLVRGMRVIAISWASIFAIAYFGQHKLLYLPFGGVMTPAEAGVQGARSQPMATRDGETLTRWIKEARKAKADVVAFPELAVTGYPPEDLLLKPRFVADNLRALDEIVKECRGLLAVVGYVGQGQASGKRARPPVVPAGQHELSNAAAVLSERGVVASYSKWLLPNYGVFDESRYFHPGRTLPLIALRGATVGVNICEDIWFPDGPTRHQAAAGADVIININASPFHIGKSRIREQMLATRARENGVIVTYTNTVGGPDAVTVYKTDLKVLTCPSDVTSPRLQPSRADLNFNGNSEAVVTSYKGVSGDNWGADFFGTTADVSFSTAYRNPATGSVVRVVQSFDTCPKNIRMSG